MAETNDIDARRAADLSVAELRQLIEEVVSEEGEIFAMGIRTEADLLLEKFRTLVTTSNPNWADLWANRWDEIAAHLERTLREYLRVGNAPASARDVARELARYSDRELNRLLWNDFPTKDLVSIRSAVHKRLGVSASACGDAAENEEAHRAASLKVLSEALLLARDALAQMSGCGERSAEAEHVFWLVDAVHNLPALFMAGDRVWDKSDVLGELARYDERCVPEKLMFLAEKRLRSMYEEAVGAYTAPSGKSCDDGDSRESRLASRGADHWTIRAAQVETILTERLRARNVPAAAADVVVALGECTDADLNGLLRQSCSAHELAGIRAAVRARLGVGDVA